ncbi:hypothetical protein NL43_01930 [Methanosphaera sp. WGK6]|nr:hypothetical protein NL43_01930 [Methanosphaera sp. WGK6]
MWENFSEYIIQNYGHSNKIIEVGVGKILEPSTILKQKLPQTTIKLVDINPYNETIIQDDITKPTSKIYENADLIYSIRPPEELQPDIFKLSEKFNCDILIKPLFTEEINYKYQNKIKLVNYKKMALYILKK